MIGFLLFYWPMLDSLNFFAPYESLAGHHENQLTRALLVVLRYCPLAHATWLYLVDPSLRLEELPPARFRTQKAQLVLSKQAATDEAAIRGISVWLAPDAGQAQLPVGTSDRRQILDGIVEYGDALVMAIENKVYPGQLTLQPSSINTGRAVVEFDPHVRSVSWQTLLEAMADLSLRGLVEGAEKKLLDDFLTFAEHHFPQVGPYSTLRRAAFSCARVKRRLEAVISAVTGVAEPARQDMVSRNLPPHLGGEQRSVEMVALDINADGDRLCLRLWPGDTLTQAKVLFKRAGAVRGLPLLPGWTVRPNYHWGFVSSNLAPARGTIAAAEYIEYWVGAIRQTRAVPRERWEAEWERLEKIGIVTSHDRAKFDKSLVKTKIPNAIPRPGLRCEYTWTFDDAVALDESGKLVETVQAVLAGILHQMEEPWQLPDLQV